MARFNHTDRTLETLKDFIFNQTGTQISPYVSAGIAGRVLAPNWAFFSLLFVL